MPATLPTTGHWITTDSGQHILIEPGKGSVRAQVKAHYAAKGQAGHPDEKAPIKSHKPGVDPRSLRERVKEQRSTPEAKQAHEGRLKRLGSDRPAEHTQTVRERAAQMKGAKRAREQGAKGEGEKPEGKTLREKVGEKSSLTLNQRIKKPYQDAMRAARSEEKAGTEEVRRVVKAGGGEHVRNSLKRAETVTTPSRERDGFSGDGQLTVTARWPGPGQPTLAGRGSLGGCLTTGSRLSGEQPGS